MREITSFFYHYRNMRANISFYKEKYKMNYKLNILKTTEENNGYITTKEVANKGIPKIYLTQLVREEKLMRVSRGFYMLPDCFEDDYFEIQLTNSDAVFF